MDVLVDLPKSVRRLVANALAQWDPRTRGGLQIVPVPAPSFQALLEGEESVKSRALSLTWALDLDPRNGKRRWKVSPAGPADAKLVRDLVVELEHHFDDPREAV